MALNDIKSIQITLNDTWWHQMTYDLSIWHQNDTIWHQNDTKLYQNDTKWHMMTSNDILWHISSLYPQKVFSPYLMIQLRQETYMGLFLEL